MPDRDESIVDKIVTELKQMIATEYRFMGKHKDNNLYFTAHNHAITLLELFQLRIERLKNPQPKEQVKTLNESSERSYVSLIVRLPSDQIDKFVEQSNNVATEILYVEDGNYTFKEPKTLYSDQSK